MDSRCLPPCGRRRVHPRDVQRSRRSALIRIARGIRRRRRRLPGGAFGGANASIGTISSVNGNTIYITDTSGNTVKVTLSSATKITKSLGVSKHSLRPGDSVVIRGLKNSSGKVSATSISDSGASNAGSGATGGVQRLQRAAPAGRAGMRP